MKDKNFWRFFALMMLLVLVKTEWHHNAATLPKFLIRLHGDRVPYASIASINCERRCPRTEFRPVFDDRSAAAFFDGAHVPAGIMCAFLPPIVQSVLSHVGHVDIIMYGTYLMGIAPFIMVLSSTVGAACFWNVVYT